MYRDQGQIGKGNFDLVEIENQGKNEKKGK
jgi:hypothetical protein